jgi:uncharacterized protein (DUF433 family)
MALCHHDTVRPEIFTPYARAVVQRGDLCIEEKVHTISAHVEVTPGAAGGKPRMAGHRITVQDIVLWHERVGLGADEVATEYGLTLTDVYAAIAYYYDHREAIDQAFRTDDELIATLRQRTPSKG